MSRTYCLKIMIKRDKLIVFLGSVGIGKSTVIKGLAYVLKARGFRTYRIFIKAFHGSAYILWVFIVKLLGLSDNSKYSPWLLVQRSGRIVLERKLLVLSIYLDAFISIPLKIIIVRVLRRFGITFFLRSIYNLHCLITYLRLLILE